MAMRAALICCLVTAWLLSVAPAIAGDFSFSDKDWRGTSQLVEIAKAQLGDKRVRVVDVLDWEVLTPKDGVMVLHPERDLDYIEALAFLRAGGRLAILDDFGRGESLLQRFKIGRVDAPQNPLESIRDNPHLAIAVPAVQLVAGHEQGRHPIVASVGQLVTNHPTGLTHPNLTPVLTIPSGSHEPEVTLAVTGIIADRGRLLAMGDPSAVINLMLRYPGNRAFAEGIVEYLVEDDAWGERGGTLYLLTNDFKQEGSYDGRSSLTKQLQNRIDSVREEVSQMHDQGMPNTAALVLAALATLIVIAWIASTSTRPYRPTVPRYARGTSLVAQGGTAGRAAVLAAPTTHRALALLELKSALVDGLAERLSLPAGAGEAEILAEIDRQQALSPPSSKRLRALLLEMKKAESAVVAAAPVRVTTTMVERMHSHVKSILTEVDNALEQRS